MYTLIFAIKVAEQLQEPVFLLPAAEAISKLSVGGFIHAEFQFKIGQERTFRETIF